MSKELWRNFAMKQPRPSLVKVYVGDQLHELEVDESTNFARLGETIDALEPERVECYSDNETLLRAEKRKGPKGVTPVNIPGALHSDPNAAMMMLFANLLHRAYEHQSDVAFGKLAEMFELMSQRNAVLERECADLRQQNAELQSQVTELEVAAELAANNGGGDLVDSFLSGMNAGGGPAANGKAPS